jgi:hypothetical protein
MLLPCPASPLQDSHQDLLRLVLRLLFNQLYWDLTRLVMQYQRRSLCQHSLILLVQLLAPE